MQAQQELIKKIDRYLERNPKYPVAPPKKKEKDCTYLQDGIMKFKISFLNLSCQCGTKMCNHILFLLFEKYKLSYYGVIYLDRVYNFFLINQNDSNLSHIIDAKIDDHFNQDVCGICLAELVQQKDYLQFFICDRCNKAVHQKCSLRWFQKEKTCVYCRVEVTL